MQLDRGPERTRSEAERIPFGSCPRAPFDDHDETADKQLLRKFPLQRFDLGARGLVVEMD